MNGLSDLYQPFAISFIVSAVAAYPIFKLLLAMKSRQTVSQFAPEGHQVKQGTPTMGGLIIAVGFLAVPGWSVISKISTDDHRGLRCNAVIFGLFLGFALIGFIDDFVVPRLSGKRGLGWKQKIFLQFGVAAICSLYLYSGPIWQPLVMVFLVLFFSNAYNFSDGLDALAAFLLIGILPGLLAISAVRSMWGLAPTLAALLGGIWPFLYLNKPKAKIFMGDVGSLPIGAVLGFVITELVLPSPEGGFGGDLSGLAEPFNGFSTVGMPYLIVSLIVISGMMIVELVPVPLQILSVKLRKKKLFSFTPIHHAYERKGWHETQVVLVFAACQILLTILAVLIACSGRVVSLF